MGIKNLWQLLSPVGRSVSIETLSGKTLAVDVSIWLTQFIKAMRDDEGKVMKNAHIIGTLRRVVKLLFHRIRPVFVFDGGAPALKARTLAARRKIRSEGSDTTVRKTAQRILASQLRKHKAAVNAANRDARAKVSTTASATFTPIHQDDNNTAANTDADSSSNNNNDNDNSDRAKRRGRDSRRVRKPTPVSAAQDKDNSNEAAMNRNIDDENDMSDSDEDGVEWEDGGIGEGGDGRGALGAGRRAVVDSDGDEVWEDVSDAAGGRGGGTVGRSSMPRGDAANDGGDDDDDGDDDEDNAWEEVNLPDKDEDIDPEVIASLPGHVKKQVIEAAQRRQRLRSRAQYMPVAGNPAMYSQTQLSNFLRGHKLNKKIMRARTNDESDGEGKRIASEAGRRYIMTSPEKNKANIQGNHAAGGKAAAGAGVGSRAAADGSDVGGAGKRRRRITDDGDAFEEWSYNKAKPTSRADDEGTSGVSWSTARKTGKGAAVNESDGSGLSSDDARSNSAAGRVRARGKGSGSARILREEEGEDEEGGGFLPADDDDESIVASKATVSRSSEGGNEGKGERFEDRTEEQSDDDAEGGGFIVELDTEKDTAGAPARTPPASKGKGKAKAKEQPEDRLEDMDGSDPEKFDGNGNSSSQNGRRLRRLKHASEDDSDLDDSYRDDDGSDGDNKNGKSATRLRPLGKHEIVGDIASEAVARRLQEEEDQRAAVSLQSNVDSDVMAGTEIPSLGSASRTGLGVEDTGLLTRSGKARVPVDARRKAAGLSTAAQTGPMEKKSAPEMDVKTDPAGSAGRGEKSDVGLEIDLANMTGNENTEIELEIDLKDLDPGASGGAAAGGDGSGGRSALMELFASAGASEGICGGGAGEGGHDSDEDYEGFEDVQEEDEEEDEVRQERAESAASNDAALRRSVDMASRMAGWAGRVVERVLKEHKQTGAVAAPMATATPSVSSSHTSRSHPLAVLEASVSSPTSRIIGAPSAPAAGAGYSGAEKLLPRDQPRRSGSGVHGRELSPLPGDIHKTEEKKEGNVGLKSEAEIIPKIAGVKRSADVEPKSGVVGVENTGSVLDEAEHDRHGEPNSRVAAVGRVGRSATVVTPAALISVGTTPRLGHDATSDGHGSEEASGSRSAEDVMEPASSTSANAVGRAECSSTVESDPAPAKETRSGRMRSKESEVSSATVVGASDGSPQGSARQVARYRGSDESTAGGAEKTSGPSATAGSKVAETSSPFRHGGAMPNYAATADTIDVASEKRLATTSEPSSAPMANADVDTPSAPGKPAGAAANAADDKRAAMSPPSNPRSAAGGERAATSQPSDRRSAGEGAEDTANTSDNEDDLLIQLGNRSNDNNVPPEDNSSGAGAGGAAGGTVNRESTGGSDFRHQGGGGGEGWGGMDYLGDMDESELALETEKLRRESHKAQRDAETVTDEMKEEVMDLLRLFGVPYVVAPMEAEAQCCELERLRLVDGTVTDDSDAFAFGGKTVYKNIFNDRKFVEAYLLADAEKDLGVSTDEVIALALLLGSDYTEGVKGVGIVNAMEIINAFPLEGKGPHHGLSKFKKWIDGFDPVLDQELENLVKNGTKSEIESLSLETRFHIKHRSARNRWTVSEGFPSQEVVNAYQNPEVDHSEERFSWAQPDIDGLRALCQRVLGWRREQTDSLVMPMVKELENGSFSQPRIDKYFMTYHDNKRVAAIKSKRLRTAVEDLAGTPSEVLVVRQDGGNATSIAPATKRRKTGGTNAAKDAPRNKDIAEDVNKRRAVTAAVRERGRSSGGASKRPKSTKSSKSAKSTKSAKSMKSGTEAADQTLPAVTTDAAPTRRRNPRRGAAVQTRGVFVGNDGDGDANDGDDGDNVDDDDDGDFEGESVDDCSSDDGARTRRRR